MLNAKHHRKNTTHNISVDEIKHKKLEILLHKKKQT